MSKPFSTRPRAFAKGLAYFLPGWVVFASAAFLPQPWTLSSLLLGNALILVAVGQAFATNSRPFAANILRGASTFLILQLVYVALLALALASPLAAVLSDHALPSALWLSAVVFVALLALWRLWPAFGLPATDKLAGRSPPFASAVGALSVGARLTSRHDVYFASGLIVSISMLLLGAAALEIAGFGPQLPSELQGPALIGYAAIVCPLAMFLIIRCTQAALREDHAFQIGVGVRDEPVTIEAEPVAEPILVPRDIVDNGRDRREINAALVSAAACGDINAAIAALEQGADPDLVPEPGARDQRSVLVLACLCPNLALLRALIAKGVDVNRAHCGLPALIAATRDSHQGRPDAVMTLLTNGADPRCVDAEGNTPLHYAARAAQPVVAALLCDAGAPIDATNHEGQTPLAIASSAGKLDSVRFLLERRANPQVDRAQPALVAAAAMSDDDPDVVKILLKHKASVDARDIMGRTALISAALHDNPDIAAALLKAGADVNAADDRGTTALMEAARAGAPEVVEILAAYQPAIDGVDRLGRTALMLASQSAQADEGIVRQLIALGASTTASTPEGRRAVDLAAAAGRWGVVQLLDPEYPLPASVDSRGDSPVQRGVVTSAHLLDALRFAHWPIVDAFAPQVRAWEADQLAHLFAELATHPDPQARTWLLVHGLDPNAALADDTGLLEALLARLPETLSATEQLLSAGAQAAGVRLLPAVFDALRTATDAQRIRLEAVSLEMLVRGADPFGTDSLGRTPLACSIAHGQARAVEWLVARGADPNLRDRYGRSPLFAALVQPAGVAEPLVRALIRAGADPELADANGETPLGIALAQPQSEIRRWLNWTAWKLPKRPLRDGDLPAAAKLGDVAAVEKLLDLGLAIDATDVQGATALVHAAGAGHVDLVLRLLDRGAQSERAAAAGATALSAAVSARRSAVVAAMLERKIDPDQRLAGGGTALMIAAALGYPEIIAQLLAHGADPNAQDERATRALHAAAQFAFASRDTPRARKVLELLMEKGADLNAIDGKGRTPLLLLLGARAEPGSAGDQQHLQALLSLFLVGRADVNRQDERGVSALHACAMHGLLIPARALLAARADPEARDMRGRTPREVANLLGYLDVSAELIMRPLSSTPLPGQPAEYR